MSLFHLPMLHTRTHTHTTGRAAVQCLAQGHFNIRSHIASLWLMDGPVWLLTAAPCQRGGGALKAHVWPHGLHYLHCASVSDAEQKLPTREQTANCCAALISPLLLWLPLRNPSFYRFAFVCRKNVWIYFIWVSAFPAGAGAMHADWNEGGESTEIDSAWLQAVRIGCNFVSSHVRSSHGGAKITEGGSGVQSQCY